MSEIKTKVKMQLFVRSCDRTFTVTVDESSTVNDLKEMIEDAEFIPSDLQRLVSGTKSLASGVALLSDVLEEQDTVTLLLDVDGGMRAKWRKKRMRRLRRKRRKMRQRAR